MTRPGLIAEVLDWFDRYLGSTLTGRASCRTLQRVLFPDVEGGGVSDWSLARRMLSRGAQGIGLLLLPGVLGRLSDPMSGYFMVRREAIAGCLLNPLGYKILVEVVGRGRIRSIAEIGYVFRERAEGASKVTWRIYLEYLQHLARLRLTSAGSGRCDHLPL